MAQRDLTKLEGRLHTAVTSPRRRSRPGRYGRTEWPCIRACVTKRKISGGTMSTAGRTARDVLLGLMKTCGKLKVSFFRYLGDRLHIPGAITIPPLLDLVRQAATTA